MSGLIDAIVDAYDVVKESTQGWVYKFIVSIIILLIGFIVGRIIGRIIYKLLHSFEVNDTFAELTGATLKIEEIAETFTTYFIYFITVVLVLQQIGIVSTVLYMIASGVIVLIILSTFLGFKDFLPNAIAGFYIQSKKKFQVGQKIKVKGMQGKIIKITLLEMKIETKDGDIIFIPNSVLSKTEVTYIVAKKRNSKKNSKEE